MLGARQPGLGDPGVRHAQAGDQVLNPKALDVGPALQPGLGDPGVGHAQAGDQVVAAAGREDAVAAFRDIGQAGQLVQLLRNAHAESAARQAAGTGGGGAPLNSKGWHIPTMARQRRCKETVAKAR